MLGDDTGFIGSSNARKYIHSLNKLTEWSKARKKLIKINQKKSAIRPTISPLHIAHKSKTRNIKKRAKSFNKVTKLVFEGVRYLLQSNPSLASDEQAIIKMAKRIKKKISGIPSIENNFRKNTEFRDESLPGSDKKQKTNPDPSQEINALGTS